jgi:hypothetical protein
VPDRPRAARDRISDDEIDMAAEILDASLAALPSPRMTA